MWSQTGTYTDPDGAAGVKPSNKAHGYRLRVLARRAVNHRVGAELHRMVRHSYDYWRQFLAPVEPLAATYGVIRREVARHTNALLCRRAGLSANGRSVEVDPDVFCEDLLRRGVHPERLRQAVTDKQ